MDGQGPFANALIVEDQPRQYRTQARGNGLLAILLAEDECLDRMACISPSQKLSKPLVGQQLVHLAMAKPHGSVEHIIEYGPLQKGLNVAWIPIGQDRFGIDAHR